MGFFSTQNPGIGGLDEITDAEALFLQNLAALSYVSGDILYHDGSNLNRLAKGSDGEFLKLASGAPSWSAETGLGDLLADGSTPLTANWDVGAFTITGTQFISDIAIGTPPFVVTSTTEVANLQAATVGTITGLAPDTATTQATQPNITSLGTLTALQVDNININGNTISSTAGTDLLITPLAGQQIVLDGTIVIDAGVVTGATSITSTSFVGALTGNADTVTTNANLTGVVTSTGNATAIANKALAIAKLADGTDGELITWDASGVIATVSVGTSGQVLTSNGVGTAPTMQDSSADAFAQTSKPTTYWTTQIPITSITTGTSGTLSTWTISGIDVTGSGTFTNGHFISLLSDGANNFVGGVKVALETGSTGDSTFNSKRFSNTKKLVISFMYKMGASGANFCFGLYDGTNSTLYDPTATANSIVFTFDGTNLNAKTSDDTSQTESSNITGYTVTNWNYYRIEFDPGSEVRFYINDTLEATNTTNLPSNSDTISLGFGCSATSKRYGFSSPLVSVEL